MTESHRNSQAKNSHLMIVHTHSISRKLELMVRNVELYRQQLAKAELHLSETLIEAKSLLAHASPSPHTSGPAAKAFKVARATEKTCYFGWIMGLAKDREQLEGMGVTVGDSYDEESYAFTDCIVPEAALALLEPLWMTSFVWGLGKEIRFSLGVPLETLSEEQLLASRAHWQGKINGQQNDGLLTAASSADLDYFTDMILLIEENLEAKSTVTV